MDYALLKRLEHPEEPIDVVLDTDTYNEIDDQFALAYLLRSGEKLRTVGLCAAPFYNQRSNGPADGMEKSYSEILKLLDLAGCPDLKSVTYRGSAGYLPDETTPVRSDAAEAIVKLAREHTPEKPLYVVAIGAITNVASAILLDAGIIDRVVLVWLGGNAWEWQDTREFNMRQDIAAARVVFGCGAALVQLPCMGVVSAFHTSAPELDRWLLHKNALCDYLVENTVEYMGGREKLWSKVIWDVTAIAWLLDGNFMMSKLAPAPIPTYDGSYAFDYTRHMMRVVTHINRDAVLRDLFEKLTKQR